MAASVILKSIHNLASSTYYIENTLYVTKITNIYSSSAIFVKLTNNLRVNLLILKTGIGFDLCVNYHTLETLHHRSTLIYDRLNLGCVQYMPVFISCNKVHFRKKKQFYGKVVYFYFSCYFYLLFILNQICQI